MMYRTSVSIMAHPKRAEYVKELCSRLGYPAYVAWDRNNDRHDTGERALATYELAASHHLVLQDDAIPCQDLVAGITSLLPALPEGVPVSLYTGVYRKFIHQMNVEYSKEAFNWMVTPGILWGVGILIPTSDIPAILRFCQSRTEPNWDMRISRYYEEVKKCGVWAPIPSLVDHRDGPSMIEGRKGGRRAWKFWGEDKSALAFPVEQKVKRIELVRTAED